VGRFGGLVCGVGAGTVPGFCPSVGAAALTGGWGIFCPEGRLLVGLGAGPPVACCRCDPGGTGVVAGLGAIRFGGFPFRICAGTFPPGGCLSIGEPVGVGFPPGLGRPPRVPGGLTTGEAVPEGFPPSRFGGTGFFPAAGGSGEPAEVTSAFGERSPGLAKLRVFCPATELGAPVVTLGDPVVFPLLPICGFTKGGGFGWSFGGGFCSAIVLLSFCAS